MPGRRMPLRTVTAGLVALAGGFWPNSEPSIIVRTGAHITGRHILCGPSEIGTSFRADPSDNVWNAGAVLRPIIVPDGARARRQQPMSVWASRRERGDQARSASPAVGAACSAAGSRIRVVRSCLGSISKPATASGVGLRSISRLADENALVDRLESGGGRCKQVGRERGVT